MTPGGRDEILLDASELEPPEPLQRATKILQQLQPGQYLRMQHRRLPYPLFDACKQLAIQYRYLSGRHCNWIILFWRHDDPHTGQYCRSVQA